MLPSQLLHYEKQLLKALNHCLIHLQQESRKPFLQKKLQSLIHQKTVLLPEAKWNLLLSNSELSAQLSGYKKPLPLNGDNGQQGTIATLHYLKRYLHDSTFASPYGRASMETHLQQLTASQYSGQLLASATALINTLNRVSLMLNDAGTVCPGGKASTRIERLNNVFRLFYGDDIQPYLSKITSEGRDWQQAMEALIQVLPPAPNKAMQDYLAFIAGTGRSSIWTLLQQSITRHTESWQRVLTECGKMPGQP
jgi:hypothetical protein